MTQHTDSRTERSLSALARLGPVLLGRVRAAALLAGSSVFALAGAVLWITLHAPIGDRMKSNVAFALAGIWGVAQLGYRNGLAPAPVRRNR